MKALPQDSNPRVAPSDPQRVGVVTGLRMSCLNNGYTPLPADGKRVLLKQWSKCPINKSDISTWEPNPTWRNTGIRCGDVIAIDIDVLDPDLCRKLVELVESTLGPTPLERIGASPKTLLLYKAGEHGLGKQSLDFRQDAEAHKIEFLATGQQFIAFGKHPDTGREYRWVRGKSPLDCPLEDLPEASGADLKLLMTKLHAFLNQSNCHVQEKQAKSVVAELNNKSPIHQDYLAAALKHIDADDYDLWIKVGMAIHNETTGSNSGLEQWDHWSRQSGKYEIGECAAKWETFGGRDQKITGATILAIAKNKGFDLESYHGPREDYSHDIDRLHKDKEPLPVPKLEIRNNSTIPKEILDPPGLVGLLAEYSNRAAYRDQPLFGVCAGLTTVSALTLNYFTVQPWETTLNVYLLLVAETGEGKESPRKAIKGALEVVGRAAMIREGVSSGTALLRALGKERSELLYMPDEFGRLLGVASSPNQSHLFELLSELMRLYGQANSIHTGRAYADTSNNIDPIKRPFVNIFGTTTERSLVDALGSRDVVDGTLNRFMVVATQEKAPAFQEPESQMSQQLKDALQKLSKIGDSDFLCENEPGDSRPIKVCPQAKILLEEFRLTADKSRVSDGELGPLWARAFENAVKIAGILSAGRLVISDNSIEDTPIINTEDASWAITFTNWCVSQMTAMASSHVADTEIERSIKQIRDYIMGMANDPDRFGADRDKKYRKRNLDGFVARSQITKRFQKLDSRQRNQAIATLLESEDISVTKDEQTLTEWFTPLRAS